MKLDDLRPHRTWLTFLVAGLALLLAGKPLAEWGMEKASARAEDIGKERARIEESARRFQDDMQLAEQSNGQMSAKDIDRLLAPVDRLRVAAGLERQAAAARLSHFTYTLAPEKPAKVDIIDAETMTESHLTMAADMPLDTDALAFLRSLNFVLPGRVHLQHLALSRIATDSPVSLANIHMDAEVEWLSNGAAGKRAGAP